MNNFDEMKRRIRDKNERLGKLDMGSESYQLSMAPCNKILSALHGPLQQNLISSPWPPVTKSYQLSMAPCDKKLPISDRACKPSENTSIISKQPDILFGNEGLVCRH